MTSKKLSKDVIERWPEVFGEVTDVINLPGQDLLAIKTEVGESLIPFVRQLVPIVDVAAKRVVVIPPDMSGIVS